MNKEPIQILPNVVMKHFKIFYGLIAFVFITSTVFAFQAIRQPLQRQENIQVNKVTQKTSFSYSTDALPDGITGTGGAILSKLQKNLKVHINSSVQGEKPVTIQGNYIVNYTLVAEGMWEKAFSLQEKKEVKLEGNDNAIINGDFTINFDEMKAYIEKVEKEIVGSSSGEYLIKVKPQFEGSIISDNKEVPLDNTDELTFKYSYGKLELVGENKEIIKEIPINDVKTVNGVFNLFGLSMLLMTGRYIFSIISFVSLIVLIVFFKNLKALEGDRSEAQIIDKKYRSRLIGLKSEPTIGHRMLLPIEVFKSLVQIADDKEQPLLRYGNDKEVRYYVIDGECIFIYNASVERGITFSSNLKNVSSGSDVTNA